MLRTYSREISKEDYDKGISHIINHKEDYFGKSEIYGYGVYIDSIYEDGGKFYIKYKSSDNCD